MAKQADKINAQESFKICLSRSHCKTNFLSPVSLTVTFAFTAAYHKCVDEFSGI